MSEFLFKVSKADSDQLLKKIHHGADLLPGQAIKQKGKTSFPCPCAHCSKVYKTLEDLKSHWQNECK